MSPLRVVMKPSAGRRKHRTERVGSGWIGWLPSMLGTQSLARLQGSGQTQDAVNLFLRLLRPGCTGSVDILARWRASGALAKHVPV